GSVCWRPPAPCGRGRAGLREPPLPGLARLLPRPRQRAPRALHLAVRRRPPTADPPRTSAPMAGLRAGRALVAAPPVARGGLPLPAPVLQTCCAMARTPRGRAIPADSHAPPLLGNRGPLATDRYRCFPSGG